MGQARIIDPIEVKFAETMADAMWRAATSDNHLIASSRGPIYRNLEGSLLEVIKVVYKVDYETAQEIRDMLSELGPNDAYSDSPAKYYGITSYAAGVINSRLRAELREKFDQLTMTDIYTDDVISDTVYTITYKGGYAAVTHQLGREFKVAVKTGLKTPDDDTLSKFARNYSEYDKETWKDGTTHYYPMCSEWDFEAVNDPFVTKEELETIVNEAAANKDN